MAHSKRNTSLAFFTAHERAQLRGTWGSRATHLTRDSFLPFASCGLCLRPARAPCACAARGHMFCRECAVANLLAQRGEIERLRRQREGRKGEEEAEGRRRADKEHEQEVLEFERGLAGLEGGSEGQKKKRRAGGDGVEESEGGKRRREEASVLPAWADEGLAAPVCPGSGADSQHALALKTLVDVNFTADPDGVRVCPACSKALNAGTAAVLAVPCGHVVCKPCRGKFMAKDGEGLRCYVCDESLEEGGGEAKDKKKKKKKAKVKPGLVEIRSEGTGFAAGGRSVVQKSGVAFQC